MKNLVVLRKKSHLTQGRLGEVVGYSQHAISAWEKGEREPNHETLIKLAKYFNVSIDYLLDYNVQDIKEEEKFEPYQKEIVDYIKSMNELECFQVKTYIETLKKMQTDKEQARELYNILKRNI